MSDGIVFSGTVTSCSTSTPSLHRPGAGNRLRKWKDPTHLLIRIRDGVPFQDGGKALDAEAVK
jgi:hypothetical protein